MPRTIFFVGGDSYPSDQQVETAMRAALENAETTFVGHLDIFNGVPNPDKPREIANRLRMLDEAVRAVEPNRDVFIAARSSGGRVASLVAAKLVADRPVTAIACVAYPFRFPGALLEPERFVHLARLATPMLIVQGAGDEMGGLELTEHYRLSQTIRLRFYRGSHEQFLETPDCAHIIPQMRQFIDAGWREPERNLDGFDEAYYLETYRGIADAVADGVCASGASHFRDCGWAEGLKHRMLVGDVDAFGLWADRKTDGLAYQEKIRGEW